METNNNNKKKHNLFSIDLNNLIPSSSNIINSATISKFNLDTNKKNVKFENDYLLYYDLDCNKKIKTINSKNKSVKDLLRKFRTNSSLDNNVNISINNNKSQTNNLTKPISFNVNKNNNKCASLDQVNKRFEKLVGHKFSDISLIEVECPIIIQLNSIHNKLVVINSNCLVKKSNEYTKSINKFKISENNDTERLKSCLKSNNYITNVLNEKNCINIYNNFSNLSSFREEINNINVNNINIEDYKILFNSHNNISKEEMLNYQQNIMESHRNNIENINKVFLDIKKSVLEFTDIIINSYNFNKNIEIKIISSDKQEKDNVNSINSNSLIKNINNNKTRNAVVSKQPSYETNNSNLIIFNSLYSFKKNTEDKEKYTVEKENNNDLSEVSNESDNYHNLRSHDIKDIDIYNNSNNYNLSILNEKKLSSKDNISKIFKKANLYSIQNNDIEKITNNKSNKDIKILNNIINNTVFSIYNNKIKNYNNLDNTNNKIISNNIICKESSFEYNLNKINHVNNDINNLCSKPNLSFKKIEKSVNINYILNKKDYKVSFKEENLINFTVNSTIIEKPFNIENFEIYFNKSYNFNKNIRNNNNKFELSKQNSSFCKNKQIELLSTNDNNYYTVKEINLTYKSSHNELEDKQIKNNLLSCNNLKLKYYSIENNIQKLNNKDFLTNNILKNFKDSSMLLKNNESINNLYESHNESLSCTKSINENGALQFNYFASNKVDRLNNNLDQNKNSLCIFNNTKCQEIAMNNEKDNNLENIKEENNETSKFLTSYNNEFTINSAVEPDNCTNYSNNISNEQKYIVNTVLESKYNQNFIKYLNKKKVISLNINIPKSPNFEKYNLFNNEKSNKAKSTKHKYNYSLCSSILNNKCFNKDLKKIKRRVMLRTNYNINSDLNKVNSKDILYFNNSLYTHDLKSKTISNGCNTNRFSSIDSAVYNHNKINYDIKFNQINNFNEDKNSINFYKIKETKHKNLVLKSNKFYKIKNKKYIYSSNELDDYSGSSFNFNKKSVNNSISDSYNIINAIRDSYLNNNKTYISCKNNNHDVINDNLKYNNKISPFNSVSKLSSRLKDNLYYPKDLININKNSMLSTISKDILRCFLTKKCNLKKLDKFNSISLSKSDIDKENNLVNSSNKNINKISKQNNKINISKYNMNTDIYLNNNIDSIPSNTCFNQFHKTYYFKTYNANVIIIYKNINILFIKEKNIPKYSRY